MAISVDSSVGLNMKYLSTSGDVMFCVDIPGPQRINPVTAEFYLAWLRLIPAPQLAELNADILDNVGDHTRCATVHFQISEVVLWFDSGSIFDGHRNQPCQAAQSRAEQKSDAQRA